MSATPQDDATPGQRPTATRDYVGLSVIAGWFGVTRPAVAHWMERHPNFPAPDVRIRQSGTKADGSESYVYGWLPEREAEIREWECSRPGQGAGGGRPWPSRTDKTPSSAPPATT